MRGVVLGEELGLAVVRHGDRADLHLDRAREVVAVDRGQRGAGHARCDALHVEQHLPRLVDGDGNGELVLEVHARSFAGSEVRCSRSSGVSMSMSLPRSSQATSMTSSGWVSIQPRAPMSPTALAITSGHTDASRRTGLRRRPPYDAETAAMPSRCVSTSRRTSAGETCGWSTSMTTA